MKKQEEFHNLKLKDIYDRVGGAIKARKNKKGEYLKVDIATALHVNPQDISNWAFREKFPWLELFIFSQEKGISFDLLLTGVEKENVLVILTSLIFPYFTPFSDSCKKKIHILKYFLTLHFILCIITPNETKALS